jgi:AcrR family transcriptional regulator
MARIVKEYDERLLEFLDTAQEFFFRKGYEKTSVNDIIKKMDVAKGTFYHYFKSKVDLLDRLIERFSEKAFLLGNELVQRKDMNAIDKLNNFFIAIRDFKVENIELMKVLMKVLYKDENLLMRHKMFNYNMDLLTPEFAKIIKQGMAEGCFDPPDDTETARLIFSMSLNLNEEVVAFLQDWEDRPEIIEKVEQKLRIYERAVERILGSPEGSFAVVERKIIEMFKFKENKDQ